ESGGVFVEDVVDDGPAAQAGLREDDIIVSFNGKAVSDESQLRKLIQQTKPGDKAAVIIFREGTKQNVDVIMGEAEAEDELEILKYTGEFPFMCMMGDKDACCGTDQKRVWLGVELQKLTNQLGEYFGAKDGKGVLVSSVVKDSPAAKAGILAGDVIIKIDNKPIETSSDINEYFADKKTDDQVSLEVIRKRKSKTLSATLAQMPQDCQMQCSDCKQKMGRKYLHGLKGWDALKHLEFDINMDEFDGDMKEFHIKRKAMMEDLREEIEQLKAEMEKLKEELKKNK
ncbi:MAG: PDZ domain-containing protein, partial [bacterium]